MRRAIDMGFDRPILISLFLTLSVLSVITPVLAASNSNPNPGIFRPDSHPYGLTYGQWSTRWWQWNLGIPASINPSIDPNGSLCEIDQGGPVWFLANTFDPVVNRQCTVPSSRSILLPIFSAECSGAQGEGKGELDLRACASFMVAHVSGLNSTLDGMGLVGLQNYRTQSPLFTISLSPNNLLGVNVTQGQVLSSTAVADGFWILLNPLPPGEHVVHFKSTFILSSNLTDVKPFIFTTEVNYRLTVVSGIAQVIACRALSDQGLNCPGAPPMFAPTILQTTTSVNPAITIPDPLSYGPNSSQASWSDRCNGNNFHDDLDVAKIALGDAPQWEWQPILSPNQEFEAVDRNGIHDFNVNTGLSGTAVLPSLSGDDVPFVHPFGNDYEFYIAPDPQFVSYLAPNNVVGGSNNNAPPPNPSSIDGDYQRAIEEKQRLQNGVNEPFGVQPTQFGLDAPGVIGVETDRFLLPVWFSTLGSTFPLHTGTRVVTYGRWIVDCGHGDFHSEIHPPLMIATGNIINDRTTEVDVVSRPYLVSQDFGDGGFLGHLGNEALKTLGYGGCFPPGIPCSTSLDANVNILKPFKGIHQMNFVIRPPTFRSSVTDRLVVSYTFTVRPGVIPFIYKAGPNEVGVAVTMTEGAYGHGKQLCSFLIGCFRGLVNDNDPRCITPGYLCLDIPNSAPLQPELAEQIRLYNLASLCDACGAIEPALLGLCLATGIGCLDLLNLSNALRNGVQTSYYRVPFVPARGAGTGATVFVDSLTADVDTGITPTSYSVDPNQAYPIIGHMIVSWQSAAGKTT